MAHALSRRALSPALPWLALAAVLMLPGTAGVATWGGAAPGRGRLEGGGGDLVSSGGPRGRIAGEEAVRAEGRVGVRQQWMRRRVRAGEGERGERSEQQGSNDGMDLHSTVAAAPPAAAAAAAADEGAVAADGGSGGGSVCEGLSSMQLQVGTATLASACGSSRPFHQVLAAGAAAVVAAPSQPPTLPAECRDSSAKTAVVVTTFLYDQVTIPINPGVQVLQHPYEVILTNSCQQRAISRLSINIVTIARFRSFILIPRVQFSGFGKENSGHELTYQFRVLPPLDAPDNSVIIPPGATFKFNTTAAPQSPYNITVIVAAFAP
ncbi:hypothetical protein CLOM_g583 [Closterium sp. NIES-68]|nr:hypothetical protein CLOM_g583 [Closterium sp. NIES-68]GJP59759.1 hypothetical protein CLOP_g15127 [Closterium sp. NIES-67]